MDRRRCICTDVLFGSSVVSLVRLVNGPSRLCGGMPCRPRTRVRSWTGRAANALTTDSRIPTFVAAGTRRTRVSEMRLTPRVDPARLRAMPAARVTASLQRSDSGLSAHQDDWGG